MNVTAVPLHGVVVLTEIVTEGVTEADTVILIAFDVAVVGEAQGSLDVIITVTTSPLFKVDEVKVEFVAPLTLLPLTCH